ncbi:MAG: hypothetical protein WCF26_20470 [Candidatus Sulfotelmatobacter sp.]
MIDNQGMTGNGSLRLSVGMALVCLLWLTPSGRAQSGSGGGSWTSSNQVEEPGGGANPTRTRDVHTESNGHVIDKTVTETLGPDGRYIPYSETEKESVRVNDTTVRTTERNYGTGPDGEWTLILQRQEETRSLAGGEEKTERTTSSSDGSGGLQVVQRELVDSKQVSPGVTDTKSTVYSADGTGRLGATVQTELTEKKADGKTEFKKTTMLSDGAGHWQVSEIREGTTEQQTGGGQIKEESVRRPDSNGALSVAERTVTRDGPGSGGEKRATTETYSTYVPGLTGDGSLQLVKREDTVQRTGADGQQSTTRQVEQVNPGDPSSGLQVAEQAIDIVGTRSNGVAQEQTTVSTVGPDGLMHVVLVDMGKSDKPVAVQVDMSKKPKAK